MLLPIDCNCRNTDNVSLIVGSKQCQSSKFRRSTRKPRQVSGLISHSKYSSAGILGHRPEIIAFSHESFLEQIGSPYRVSRMTLQRRKDIAVSAYLGGFAFQHAYDLTQERNPPVLIPPMMPNSCQGWTSLVRRLHSSFMTYMRTVIIDTPRMPPASDSILCIPGKR